MHRLAILLVFTLSGCGSQPDYEQLARDMDIPTDAVPICGFEDVLGVEIDDINGGAGKGCGVSDPVKVYAVGATRLSTPARVNCRTVTALRTWLVDGAQPLALEYKTHITEIKVAASYACRTRNHRRGARLSEHAKGNAIDISAITLANGEQVSVLKGYHKGTYAPLMQRLHKIACGPFGTVLGPGSDRHHNDHFHFDVADYRSGPYCR